MSGRAVIASVGIGPWSSRVDEPVGSLRPDCPLWVVSRLSLGPVSAKSRRQLRAEGEITAAACCIEHRPPPYCRSGLLAQHAYSETRKGQRGDPRTQSDPFPARPAKSELPHSVHRAIWSPRRTTISRWSRVVARNLNQTASENRFSVY